MVSTFFSECDFCKIFAKFKRARSNYFYTIGDDYRCYWTMNKCIVTNGFNIFSECNFCKIWTMSKCVSSNFLYTIGDY